MRRRGQGPQVAALLHDDRASKRRSRCTRAGSLQQRDRRVRPVARSRTTSAVSGAFGCARRKAGRNKRDEDEEHGRACRRRARRPSRPGVGRRAAVEGRDRGGHAREREERPARRRRASHSVRHPRPWPTGTTRMPAAKATAAACAQRAVDRVPGTRGQEARHDQRRRGGQGQQVVVDLAAGEAQRHGHQGEPDAGSRAPRAAGGRRRAGRGATRAGRRRGRRRGSTTASGRRRRSRPRSARGSRAGRSTRAAPRPGAGTRARTSARPTAAKASAPSAQLGERHGQAAAPPRPRARARAPAAGGAIGPLVRKPEAEDDAQGQSDRRGAAGRPRVVSGERERDGQRRPQREQHVGHRDPPEAEEEERGGEHRGRRHARGAVEEQAPQPGRGGEQQRAPPPPAPGAPRPA